MVLLPFRFSQPLAQRAESKGSNLCISGLMVGALTGAILGTPIPALSAQVSATDVKQATYAADREERRITFSVAFENDNETLHASISNRLNQINRPFHHLDWERVRQLDDLENIDVLFLPSIKTVTPRQLRVLDAWLEQGGQLIVSGHLGELSSSNVQAQLRSLLGVYWAFALPEASQLRVRDRHPLSDGMADASAIEGGVIVPTRLGSRTIATWQTSNEVSVRQGSGDNGISRRVNVGSAGAPAIVVTENTTFLGWNWGVQTETDEDFDVAWLQSVLPTGEFTAVSQEEISTRQQTPPQARSTSNSPGQDNSSEEANPVSDQQIAAPDLFSLVEFSRESDQESSAQPEQETTEAPLPIAPVSTDDFVDPTQQIAPAGLDVQQNARPIHILEKLAMTRELENLIGRFESALLASRVHGDDDVVSQTDSILVASASNQPGIASELADASDDNADANIMDHPALLQAKTVLEAFPDLVDERRYEEARQQWIEARQLLWENFPIDRPIAQPEVRAIWLDRGTIVEAGSRRRLAEIFDQLANAGINTIFVETVNAGYPIYPSRVAPEQNPLTRNWDPLDAAVDLAHERGMEVHAWVWVFAAGNQRHNTIVNLPWSYPGPILAAHPQWANADRQGRAIPVGQDKPFLDPAHPEVRQYLLRLYEEIVTQYDVDGLHLDYIRYPFQNAASGRSYGYGAASRQRFRQLTGIDPLTLSPNDRELWQQWTDFRIEQVNSFVAETADQIRQLRPDMVLSAAVFAMSEHERIQKLQQQWEVWAREGDIDMIVTMSYALDTNRFQQLTSPWLLEADLGSTLVVPGIQLFNITEEAAFDQIQSLRDMPAGGYALFAAEHLNDDLRTIFNQTQGTEQIPLAPVPFRDPFTTASARFNALQEEWDFMIDSGALWMRRAQRDELMAASEEVQAILNELSDSSSTRDIQQAQESFEQFTTRFEDWMYLQSFSHSYRVQIWQNRLTVIATLLNYGGDRLQ